MSVLVSTVRCIIPRRTQNSRRLPQYALRLSLYFFNSAALTVTEDASGVSRASRTSVKETWDASALRSTVVKPG